MSMTASEIEAPAVQLGGVHHTARPTWKFAETVHFYRDQPGLPLVHAISAHGWGPDDHADFLHALTGGIVNQIEQFDKEALVVAPGSAQ